MNSEFIFAQALGLSTPWQIREVEFSREGGERILHIYIDFERGAQFEDPEGSGARCPVHDTLERSWRHLNFFEHRCYLHCRVPRVRTPSGQVKQVRVPWGRPGSGFSMLFEAYAMALIESEMPVNKVGKLLGEYPNRIWTIFNYWTCRAYKAADHSAIRNLGIDETSSRKGHDYLTVAVDMDQRRVVHVTRGKGADTIQRIEAYLADKGSSAEQIGQVCIDLSPSFISGVEEHFPEASITYDRFHVKALLNQAMDEVRKAERRRHAGLKGQKYTFLKAPGRLGEQAAVQRHAWLELYPSLGEAYRLKELFDDFWHMSDPQEAEGFLAFWCDMALEADLEPFTKFVRTIQGHWNGILAYISSRLTNGILEGLNSKIQLIKRRARGFKNPTNFIHMIYYTCGKLTFDYPQYLT